jgi:hypothetical protein
MLNCPFKGKSAGCAGGRKRGVAMKFAVLVVAAAAVGSVATVAVPSSLFDSGAAQWQSLEDRASAISLRDLNPFRAIYDREMAEVRKGHTPEELGLHPSSTAGYKLYQFPTNGIDLNGQSKPGQPYVIHNGQRVPMN